MCGRYTLHPDREAIQKAYRLTSEVNLSPRWNIAPGTRVPAIFPGSGQTAAILREATWGFLVQIDGEASRRVINARIETVQTRPLFRDAYEQRRCILPASGFYEWTSSQTHGVKHPSWIHPANRAEIFHLAGIWRENGSDLEVVILTEAASPPILSIHHRMPVFIAPEAIDRWLHDPHAIPSEAVSRISVAPDTVHLNPVSLAVNAVRNDGPDLITPTRPPPLQSELPLGL